MIQKLRRKFVVILMSVVTLVFAAVFMFMLLSSWNNSRRMSENILRQALAGQPRPPEGFFPPQNGPGQNPTGQNPPGENPFRTRVPSMVAERQGDGRVSVLSNQLYFVTADEAAALAQTVMSLPERTGVLSGYKLRWLKSEDGARAAFADISMEQEMLRNLIVNALMIGGAALAVLFCISLLLARWAVRPVEQAWERQRQFVADASHELKTPLTVILSNAAMLSGAETFGDEKSARRLEHIRAEATRMKKLVEDMLTLAKSDDTRHGAVQSRVDFSYLVTSVLLTFEPVAFDAQKTLVYDVAEYLYVSGDADRLRHLTGILLDNAVKYSPAGGSILVSLHLTDKKSVLLTVRNEGAPIPAEELTHIFRRFYRVDKARSAPGSFGLGLSIAEDIVLAHGGKIWAESRADTGNSFFVLLNTAGD